MPFKSRAQMKWMFANRPADAKRWAGETKDIPNLPEHVAKGKTVKKRTQNSSKAQKKKMQNNSDMGKKDIGKGKKKGKKSFPGFWKVK